MAVRVRRVPFDAICSTHRAQRPALCVATQMCAGCAVSPTSPSWRRCRRPCSRPCGRCCSRRTPAVLHLFRLPGRGAMPRCKRFLHNTDAQLLPSPGHLIPGNADKGGAVPDNLTGDHDGFYALLQNRRNEPLGVRWWWLCAWFVLFWGAVFCWVPQAGAAQAASLRGGRPAPGARGRWPVPECQPAI